MLKDDINKIERYISGNANDNEKKYVESLFFNGEEDTYLKHYLEKDWDSMLTSTPPSKVELSFLLDRIYHIISNKEIIKRQKPLQKILRIYMKAAAILLLPLFVAVGLYYSFLGYKGKITTDRQVNATIIAPMGARVSFNLPDGTTGILNSGSKLNYNLPFKNKRTIDLEGEAWLEVAHDEKHPLNIIAGNSMIEVIGTSLNVSAYTSDNYIEVVLLQGKVNFISPDRNERVSMLPSEKLIYRNKKIDKSFVDPLKYNAWIEGKLVFRGDPMIEVVRRIERWYNVEINLTDKEIEQYSFRGTFQNDFLEDVLWCLSLTSPIQYKITPRALMSDGSFKKEEVTIYKKN